MTVPPALPTFTPGSRRAPGALPLLGHAWQLQRRPLAFLRSLPRHGDLVEIGLGPRRAYAVCHPDLVRQVLTDARTFDKGGPIYDKLRQLLGNGLGTSAREPHRRQRRMIQPVFHAERIREYVPAIRDEVVAATAGWSDGQVIDVAEHTYKIITRVLTRTMFAAEARAEAATVIAEALPVFHEGVGRRMNSPFAFLEKVPTSGNRRYEAAKARLHSLVDRLIADHRRDGADHDNLLSVLMAAGDGRADGGASAMTDEEIHEHVITFLVAGIPTSAAVLAWSLHFLGQDPGLEARLHSEVDLVLDDGPPTWAHLGRLDLTTRTLTEVMRYYPPGWLLTRVAMHDTVLAGRRIPEGTVILFSPYLLHHRPDLHPAPGLFDPDRWLPERRHAMARDTFIPYGIGSRKCIGEVYGIVELTLALSVIARRWRLTPVPGAGAHLTDPKPSAVIHPAPLTMRLGERGATRPRA
ncbi:cytochrome P450 [Streptomyces sp. BE303]|uniref:cytochrome P450 n=1 Tax=Streptomyces sp. BE303 TaxID=3002528 RepID=UPI002E77E0CF|nr:cytochrome P450 [Streptomyces sp. BE303]MED7950623.1 cytochrome P450 [Streptomyces sp. BE303]